MQDYRKELEDNVRDARKRLADITAKESLVKKPEGKILIDYITDRISQLMNTMTNKDPLTDRQYLSVHGGVRELQLLMTMLHTRVEDIDSLNEEIATYEQQLTDINES